MVVDRKLEQDAMVVERKFVEDLVRRVTAVVEDEDDVVEDTGEDEEEENEDESQHNRLKALKRLWDMSINRGICELLCELGIVDALEALLLSPSSSPRMLEVVLGLLANLLSDAHVSSLAVQRAALVRRLAEERNPLPLHITIPISSVCFYYLL